MNTAEAFEQALKRSRCADTLMREKLPEAAQHEREQAQIYATLALAAATAEATP